MKTFLGILFALNSLSTYACSVLTHFDEMDELGTELLKKAAPGTANSQSEDALIKNCVLDAGQTKFEITTSRDRTLKKFKEQRSFVQTVEFKANFSCEFNTFPNNTENVYKRLPFKGKLLYMESIIYAPGTSCENVPYSYVLAFSVNGYKDGFWKVEDMKEMVEAKK